MGPWAGIMPLPNCGIGASYVLGCTVTVSAGQGPNVRLAVNGIVPQAVLCQERLGVFDTFFNPLTLAVTRRPEFKVFRAIVVTHPVFVMNRFAFHDRPPDHLLHHGMMFRLPVAATFAVVENSVTVLVEATTFAARHVGTSSRAILLRHDAHRMLRLMIARRHFSHSHFQCEFFSAVRAVFPLKGARRCHHAPWNAAGRRPRLNSEII